MKENSVEKYDEQLYNVVVEVLRTEGEIMYDLSSRFDTFYKNHVVLSREEQKELHKKKELNINRLKAGLREYNEEHKTVYEIVETCVQGSAAMYTVIQNDENAYDIDVAIVFDKCVLGDMGAMAMRNIVADALRRKTLQFSVAPEVKTSCVRVNYSEGYHVDFAVYRREYDQLKKCWIYEHAGAEWTKRDLNGLKEWFEKQNNITEGKLRKVVRLSKMFCQSRGLWKNMPSGLLQTVLCDENLLVAYNRIDELFYHTMKQIVNRLESNTCVIAPIDNGRLLTARKVDSQRLINWKNRLKSKLEDLEVLFSSDCTRADALQTWYGFFNHSFWSEPENRTVNEAFAIRESSVRHYKDTEQHIEELYTVENKYKCTISCSVSGNDWMPTDINKVLPILKFRLPIDLKIQCSMSYTDCPQPYTILWKVKNSGPEAERRNQIRGEIVSRGQSIVEHTNFYGNHYIECYIIKDGKCVARKRVDIPIRRGE